MRPGPLGRLALARTAVDPAAEHRKDEAWLAAAWADPRAQVLLLHDGRTLVDGHRLVPVSTKTAGEGERYLLGVDVDGAPWFAVLRAEPLEVDGGPAAAGLREVGAVLDDRDAGLLVHAVALANWHASHPRCARCGEPTGVEQAGHVRRCPACGAEHFPRTDPAVIVMVTDADGRGLLARNPRWPERRFSTLAGFVEPGEPVERTVVREVREEVGLDVVDVTYLGSQPWPFPSSLMLGFTALAPDPAALEVDGEEICEARWFTREELAACVTTGEVLLPGDVSIARRLVEHWWGGPMAEPGVERW
ncbi:MAG TPA: NAD(+) diphosphatase [Candidatus Limnocylindria bacterium]|nr:NAD(+) diphosphatase [Candidatus Limnocylindria bacterium]